MQVHRQSVVNPIALVTGASLEIGAGIAKSFSADGATVVVDYSSRRRKAEEVLREITVVGGKTFLC